MAKVNAVVVALVSGNVASLVETFGVLSMADLKAARNTFNLMYTDAKAAIEKTEADAAAVLAARETELQNAVDAIMASVEGLDLEVAKDMAKKALATKYGEEETEVKGKTWTFEKVKVNVNGNVVEMPVRGNMSEALKALVTGEGFALTERAAFIEKFKVAE